MASAKEYKIVVVGAGGVGKSGMTLMFCANKCPKRYDPTIEDSYRKTCEVDGKPCTLDILDTAGQEEYAQLRSEYMAEGKGFVLVYSITDEKSFAEMQTFKDQLEKYKRPGEKVPIALIGNKVDLEQERVVSTADGEALAAQWREGIDSADSHVSDILHMEASAMTKINVDETFKGLVRLMMAKEGGGAKASGPIVADPTEPKTSGDKASGSCECVIS